MDLYMMIYFGILSLFFMSAEMTCSEADISVESDGGVCDVDGHCDVIGQENRNNRETEDAHALELYFRLERTLINAVGGETIILEEVEHFFHQYFGIQPKDLFNLQMSYNEDLSEESKVYEIQKITFVLQPESRDVSLAIEEIRAWTECARFHCPNKINLFGFEMYVVGKTFLTFAIGWNGIRTRVHFEIDIEYDLLESKGLLEATNKVAEFLRDKFLISIRDIYDLTLTNAARETFATGLVEFSLPPIIAHDILALLMSLETFVNRPCADGCKQQFALITKDECRTCEPISLFGTNVYPIPHTFKSSAEEWTGNETRYKVTKDGSKCQDHQELCTSSNGVPKCVGIGRCEKFFYKTIEGSIGIEGNIRLLDVYGLEHTITTVEDTFVELLEIPCKSALRTEFFEHGRTTTGVRLKLKPFLGRKKAIEALEDIITTTNTLTILELTITMVENSYTKSYLDPNNHVQLPKLAYDTDFVSVSILMSGGQEKLNISNALKIDMKRQLAEQIECPSEILANVNMVPAESEQYEIGLDLINQDNLTELRNRVLKLYRITDTGKLDISTTETTDAKLTSVKESFMFRQMVSGYLKAKKDTTSTSFWNRIIIGSFLPLLVLIIVLCVVVGRRYHNKYADPKKEINGERRTISEKPSRRHRKISTLLSRS